MGADGDEVRAQGVEGDRQVAGGLGGIDVDEHPGGAAGRDDFRDRLQGADLVVRPLAVHQGGARSGRPRPCPSRPVVEAPVVEGRRCGGRRGGGRRGGDAAAGVAATVAVTAVATNAASMRPSRSTGTVITAPWRNEAARTAECSTAAHSTGPSGAPHTAALAASVAPLVKITLRGRTPSNPATASRASSTAARAMRPSVWTRPGSAASPSQRAIASTTPGRGGDVDAWSR